MQGPPELLKKCLDLVNKLGISANDVQKFEDCERVTDMLQEEYIGAIKNAELRRVVQTMKKAHEGIRVQHSEPFVKKTESLYRLLPKYSAVLDYHVLEQTLETIDDSSLEQIKDPKLRKLLMTVKHVHGKGHGKRKAEIFRTIVET
jgi:hypothetical protein